MTESKGCWTCVNGISRITQCGNISDVVASEPVVSSLSEPSGTAKHEAAPNVSSEEQQPQSAATSSTATPSPEPSDPSTGDDQRGFPDAEAGHGDHDDNISQEEAKLSCFQASAMNTLNMFGTGPFITIPFVIASTNPAGPQALVGYAITAFACILDSMIWAELSSMWPKSGGSYLYLLYLYGHDRWGRMAAFLYIWQFLISGPMEIASGFVAMGQYFAYVSGNTSYLHHASIAASFCVISVIILYQGIQEAGRVTNVLWLITACAVCFTIVVGLSHFEADNLDLPPDAWGKTTGAFMMSLGTACRFGLYDFTGYYDACQMAGEVVEPRKSIPRATVITCIIVAGIYFLVYISVMGYLPWDGPNGFVQLVSGDSDASCYIMALFAEKAFGNWFAQAFTVIVMATIFGANFAMMCGCAYLPYAAAKEGHFFSILQHRHPTRQGVADYSLLLIGSLSLVFCFLPLETLVEAMMTLMLIVQFLGNSVGLLLFHFTGERAKMHIPWRVPFFPLPCILQIVVFSFVLMTTPTYLLRGEKPIIELALGFLCFGVFSFVVWSWKHSSWPFQAPDKAKDMLDFSESPSIAPSVSNGSPKRDYDNSE